MCIIQQCAEWPGWHSTNIQWAATPQHPVHVAENQCLSSSSVLNAYIGLCLLWHALSGFALFRLLLSDFPSAQFPERNVCPTQAVCAAPAHRQGLEAVGPHRQCTTMAMPTYSGGGTLQVGRGRGHASSKTSHTNRTSSLALQHCGPETQRPKAQRQGRRLMCSPAFQRHSAPTCGRRCL